MGKAEVKAVEDVYQVGRQQSAAEVAELKAKLQESAERERLLANYHQAVGQIKTANMFAEFASISALIWIQQMRETKAYKEIGTWETFCESVGFTRQHIEDQLKNLAVLGENFLQTVCGLGVGYRDLRKLRQLTHDGVIEIDSEAVQIGDERIPLDPSHREDLEAALERLIDAKNELLQEKDAVIRSNEKLLQSKQDLIHRQEKDLKRYEDEATRKGLTPTEDAFIKKMENLRISFDGYMLKVDPERNELGDPEVEKTPRMAAAYLTTLDYMRKQLLAAYDTAQDMYGSLAMSPEEAVWTQPEE